MSEPYLSTRSRTCMHYASQKVQGFFSLRRPETHFRHVQGHQRAGALTGTINIFQSTIITVYEVEHQKTLNRKFGKQTVCFLRSNQKVLPLLPKKTGWKTQKNRKQNCIAFLKLINRYCKLLCLKSTSIFKEQTEIPLELNFEKIWGGQKGITIEQIVQTSVHVDMKSTKEAIFQQKTPKSIHSWSNHFLNAIANVSVKVHLTVKVLEKTSI